MAQHTQILIASIMAVWVLFLLYAYFRYDKALTILEQDWMGAVALAIGVILSVCGYVLKGDWSTFSLIFGGILVGFGLLVILPEGLTETVIHPSNIGLIMGAIAIVGIIYYGIAPSVKYLGPAWTLIDKANTLFKQAFMVVYTNSQATQAVALCVLPILFAAGVFIFLKGRKS